MNDTERTKMIEKVRKVLALSSSPNEAEACAAADKAQAMLAEYNLTLADVAVKDEGEVLDFVQDNETVTDSVPWRRGIGSCIARMYFCTYYFMYRKDAASRSCGYIRRDTHTFVGVAHNVYVAKMMFKYLGDAVERLASEGARSYKPSERSKYQTSFKWACSQRLQARIMKRIEEAKRGGIKTESGNTLPALADLYTKTQNQITQWLEQEAGVTLKDSKKKPTHSHMGGVLDGQKAGDSIGLDTQLPESAKKLPPAVQPALQSGDLNRDIMIHICKDGTISYRTKNEPVFNGRALPVFSVNTVQQARDIQVRFGRAQLSAHPKMPGKPWYKISRLHDGTDPALRGDGTLTLEDLDGITTMFREFYNEHLTKVETGT